jgi:uncharacterized membrane protein YhaH (DUF805 family)
VNDHRRVCPRLSLPRRYDPTVDPFNQSNYSYGPQWAPGYGYPTVPRKRQSVWIYLAVGLVGLILGALSVWLGIRIAYSAALDCGVDYDAGGRFGMGMLLLFGLPTIAIVTCALSLAATRLHPAIGLGFAVLLPLAVVVLLVTSHALGTASIIPSLGPNYGSACPSRVPPWWPWWLPSWWP